jgi:hypothetical protein
LPTLVICKVSLSGHDFAYEKSGVTPWLRSPRKGSGQKLDGPIRLAD